MESPSIINPEPHPRGYSLCFLISTPTPYVINGYMNEGFFGLLLCLCRDDIESAYREQELYLVLWGMVWGISTELARGCKTIAKDSIGFKVSLCSWILPYPIPSTGSVSFSGLYKAEVSVSWSHATRYFACIHASHPQFAMKVLCLADLNTHISLSR